MKRKNAMLPPAMKSKHKDPQDRFWCECGNQKTANSTACERCTFLDGSTSSQIIPLLRSLVRANVHQLAQQADMHVRNVYGTLRHLEKIGRVKRSIVDGDTVYELISC